MQIIFLSRWYPFPPDNGAKIRIFNLLKQLGRRHDVALLTFASPTDRVDEDSRSTLRTVCRDVQVFPFREFRSVSRQSAAGFFSAQPRYLLDIFSADLAGALDRHLATDQADMIIASELAMAPYPLQRRAWPAIFEEVEVAGFHNAAELPLRTLSALRARLTWLKLSRFLNRTLGSFEASTVVSEAERQLVAAVAPKAPVPYVVPNAVDTQTYLGDFGHPDAHAIAFSGALTFAPNYQAADWFLRSIYPHVLDQVPTAQLRITGGTNGVNVSALPQQPGWELTGYVPDIRPVVARSMVSVVPLLTGGGTRLKILESMALGTPVVSTSKGAEGLDVSHGENILIADDPAEFAEYVAAVIRSPQLRTHLARGGRDLVRSHYDWDVVGPTFCDIVEHAATKRTAVAAGR